MTDTAAAVPDLALTFRAIANDATAVLSALAGVVQPTAPLRIADHPDGPLRIWHEDEALSVHTISSDDVACVFIAAGTRVDWRSGTNLQWKPDWCALTPLEARALGQALLAAAADVDCDLPQREAS